MSDKILATVFGGIILNFLILGLNLKLYTEMFKEIAQQKRGRDEHR